MGRVMIIIEVRGARQDLYGVLRYSTVQHIPIDEYVVDVLLPDLTGHDHAPTAFLVYIVLWTSLYRAEQKRIAPIDTSTSLC